MSETDLTNAPASAGTKPAPAQEPQTEPVEQPAEGASTVQPSDPKTEGQEPAPAEPEGEDYGDFSLPENISVDEESMSAFKKLAKESGLSKETAQKMVDIQAGIVKKQMDEYNAFRQKLKDDCKTEFGAQLPDTLATAAKAVDRFGGEELRKVLDDFGLGDHPVLVRTFAKIGKEVSEDAAVTVAGAGSSDITFEEAMYGKK